MGYEVIARKWRPQRFADVVGQDHVTRTLANAIQSNRLAHAYLFVGPRGTGKTTTARILAKALNCMDRKEFEPCNECASCREIIKGASLDVIEIDGASNRGIDDVKELRDNVRYAPIRGPFKIYIIDEVHMLTREAFNAILKTLEEPPAHVKFFFATTEPQKVLATILSRCQRFDLRRISISDITGQLSRIATAEGIEISADALLAVARGAEGGLRDAESALDQLVSFRGKTIEESDVLSVFGLISRGQMDRLAGALIGGDIPELIDLTASIDAGGKDLQRVVLELVDHFRNLLVVQSTGGHRAAALDLPEAQIETLKAQAEKTTGDRLLRIVEILIEAEGRMRYALCKRTLLETALIRASRAAVTVTIDELIQRLAQLETSGTPPGSNTSSSDPGEKKNGTEDELIRLQASWSMLADRIARAVPHSRSGLAGATPVQVSDSHVVIGLDPEFATERAGLENSHTLPIIQQTLKAFLKRPVAVRFAAARPGAEGIPPKPSEAKDKDRYYRHPAVKTLVDAFNGEITEIRE